MLRLLFSTFPALSEVELLGEENVGIINRALEQPHLYCNPPVLITTNPVLFRNHDLRRDG